jgi:hypothetical protein
MVTLRYSRHGHQQLAATEAAVKEISTITFSHLQQANEFSLTLSTSQVQVKGLNVFSHDVLLFE